jgi:hypothetical protein
VQSWLLSPRKKVIPQSWKYSLAVRDNSCLSLTIASAPLDLMAIVRANRTHGKNEGYAQLNHYYLSTEFKGNNEMCELFAKIYSTMKGAEWFDDSDSQADISNMKHHIRINLGKWDKDFIVK